MSKKLHVVVLSGAGISAESGIKTFRDAGGLWEGHSIEEVATPEAWEAAPQRVLDFYNQRRRQLYEVEPNAAHLALAELERTHTVTIITQNVDNLHERAGSTNVLHLHGELDVARSTKYPDKLYPLNGKDIVLGDCCDSGAQLRPHIVWFGEMVPEMDRAAEITQTADILIVVGTSLVVYPAAGLAEMAPAHATRYLVNPEVPTGIHSAAMTIYQENAGTGIPKLVAALQSA